MKIVYTDVLVIGGGLAGLRTFQLAAQIWPQSCCCFCTRA